MFPSLWLIAFLHSEVCAGSVWQNECPHASQLTVVRKFQNKEQTLTRPAFISRQTEVTSPRSMLSLGVDEVPALCPPQHCSCSLKERTHGGRQDNVLDHWISNLSRPQNPLECSLKLRYKLSPTSVSDLSCTTP